MAFSVLLLWLCLISEVSHKVKALENIGGHTSEGSVASTCTFKEVTVRNAYLALSPISARCDTLALLLDINKGVLGNIETDCHRDNDCKCRRIIEAWYNGRPEPSWDELLYALEKMSEHDVVKRITNELLCSGEHFDKLHAGVSLNGGPKEVMHQLMNEFEQMTNSFELYLLRHPPDLEIFKRCIVRILHQPNFFAEDQHQFHLPKGLMDINIIDKADTAGEILTYFHTHMWNFLEYELFEAFGIKFGNGELQEELQKYLVQVSEFRRVTTISEFLQIWSEQSIPPSGFITYTVKFEENPYEMTLENVSKLRKKQAKSHFLPSYAFRFASGLIDKNEGCITITWFVKSAVALEIQQTMANTPDSSDKDLLYLKIGDTVIFDYLSVEQLIYATLSLFLITGISLLGFVFSISITSTNLNARAFPPGPQEVVLVTIAVCLFLTTGVLSDLESTTVGIMVGTYTGLIVGFIHSVAAALSNSMEETVVTVIASTYLGQNVGIMAGATGNLTSGLTIVVITASTFMVLDSDQSKFDLRKGVFIIVTLLLGAFGVIVFNMFVSAKKIVFLIVKVQALARIARMVILLGSVGNFGIAMDTHYHTLDVIQKIAWGKTLAHIILILLYIGEAIVGTAIFGAGMTQIMVLYPGLVVINGFFFEYVASCYENNT